MHLQIKAALTATINIILFSYIKLTDWMCPKLK